MATRAKQRKQANANAQSDRQPKRGMSGKNAKTALARRLKPIRSRLARIRQLKTEFDTEHAAGIKALSEGDFHAVTKAISAEHAIIEKQREVIDQHLGATIQANRPKKR